MGKDGTKKSKRSRWMLYIPAIFLIVFIVWIVTIAFDTLAMSTG